jgi:hypothetical protein
MNGCWSAPPERRPTRTRRAVAACTCRLGETDALSTVPACRQPLDARIV